MNDCATGFVPHVVGPGADGGHAAATVASAPPSEGDAPPGPVEPVITDPPEPEPEADVVDAPELDDPPRDAPELDPELDVDPELDGELVTPPEDDEADAEGDDVTGEPELDPDGVVLP